MSYLAVVGKAFLDYGHSMTVAKVSTRFCHVDKMAAVNYFRVLRVLPISTLLKKARFSS